MIHSALALFAQRTRIPTSARSIGFCVIWVCISSSSSSELASAPFGFVLVRVRVHSALPPPLETRLHQLIYLRDVSYGNLVYLLTSD